jgi:hypothetical protein
MYKTFIWGFQREFTPVIEALQEQNILEMLVWIGPAKACTHSRKDFIKFDINFKYTAPVSCPETLYRKVLDRIYPYLDSMAKYNRFNHYTVHDYLNLFTQHLNYYYYLLTHHHINLVLFDLIPFCGTDYILYHLACELGIKTLSFFPSNLFPGHFHFIYDMDDFGLFELNPSIFPALEKTIEKKHEKDLPYMRHLILDNYPLKKALPELLKGNWQAIWRYTRYQQYRQRLRQATAAHYDLSIPYVYFPLHFQPELTTSVFGGIYCDQMLALEALSRKIPLGITIYVKENPIQGEFMRGSGFFERLAALKNVVLVPQETNTYQLIHKARLVATITGTAGWEAITGGVPVLVFGKAWYVSMPGVYRYAEDLDLQIVMDCQINHDDLEKALSQLLTKMGVGELSLENVDKDSLDKVSNGCLIAQSITKILACYPVASEP